jgi:AcrR family transcriptional regulator
LRIGKSVPIVFQVTVSTEPRAANERPDQAGLRERKKDATRRSLAEAALGLALEHGYPAVTISDITEAVGVSRRTFSNYFSGKAECVAAVTQGWFDDIMVSIQQAPVDMPLDDLLFGALSQVAAFVPERWEKFVSLCIDEPELQSMMAAVDAAHVEQLAAVVAGRVELPADDIRVRMLSSFGITAGRLCLEDWVLGGRPGGERSFRAQLELAFSIIDLPALRPPAPGSASDPPGSALNNSTPTSPSCLSPFPLYRMAPVDSVAGD